MFQSIQTAGNTSLCIREQSLSVPSTSLWSERSPSGIYSSEHTVAAYLHCQGISVIPYLDYWPNSSQPVLSYTEVSQFMGSLNWASGLILLGHLHLRPLQRHFLAMGLLDWFTPPHHSDQSVLANLIWHWQ